MTVVSLAHAPLILAAAFAFHVCMSPPMSAPPGPDRDRLRVSDRHARTHDTARITTAVITKGFYWASAVLDTLVLLGPYIPTSPHTISLPVPIPTFLLFTGLPSWICHPPTLPLLSTTGTLLALAGALLRRAAYRTLGQFYACPNLGPGACIVPSPGSLRTSRHAHALITTGPYAFLRHPGYAGLLLCTIGFAVLHLDHGVGPGEVLCGGVRVDVGRVSAGMRVVALAGVLLGTVGAMRRMRDEERALRERFKGEWELWAESVRYKLLPGVY